MEVILIKDVQGTGKVGDLVRVSDGFARNMLLPKGLAIEATEKNKQKLKKDKEKEEALRAEEKAEAMVLKGKIEKIELKVKTKAGDNGKIFGSITSMDIADALLKEENIKIDKKKIQLDSPIKNTGDTVVKIKLYPEVSADLKVKVIGE